MGWEGRRRRLNSPLCCPGHVEILVVVYCSFFPVFCCWARHSIHSGFRQGRWAWLCSWCPAQSTGLRGWGWLSALKHGCICPVQSLIYSFFLIIVGIFSISFFKLIFLFFKKILFIYLFIEGKGERKRGRETSMCGCFLCTPYWGPGLQPRHVP